MISETLRMKMLVTQIKNEFDYRWRDISVKVIGTKLRVTATPILSRVKFRFSVAVISDSLVPVLVCKDVDLEVKIDEFARKVVKLAEDNRDSRVRNFVI